MECICILNVYLYFSVNFNANEFTNSISISFTQYTSDFFFRRLLGNFNILTVSFLPSFFSSLTAIILEKPSRRTLLCLYVSNIVSFLFENEKIILRKYFIDEIYTIKDMIVNGLLEHFQATETWFRMAVSRGYVSVIPHGEVYIFAAGIATLLYLFRSNKNNSDSIFKILR